MDTGLSITQTPTTSIRCIKMKEVKKVVITLEMEDGSIRTFTHELGDRPRHILMRQKITKIEVEE